MANDEFGIYDCVSIAGELGIWKIVGTRSDGPFEVPLGNDAGTKKFVEASELTLVEKYKGNEASPGFYPGKSIM